MTRMIPRSRRRTQLFFDDEHMDDDKADFFGEVHNTARVHAAMLERKCRVHRVFRRTVGKVFPNMDRGAFRKRMHPI